MIPELLIFLGQAIVISLSGVMAPGPVTTATISASSRTPHAGALIAIGHGLFEIPLIVAIVAGLGVIFEMTNTKIIIGLIGGLFLIWMGYQMFRSLSNSDTPEKSFNTSRPILVGFLLSVTNPYFLLWWATVGLALANQARSLGFIAVVLFALVHWLCDLVWLEAISFTTNKGSELISPKRLNQVLKLCSIALIYFGLTFIINAATSWYNTTNSPPPT